MDTGTTSPDGELARRSQRGDVGAYAELMRRHRRMVFGVAYAILGSADDAEDATQEAFVRAYQALHQHNPDLSFRAWLRRIAANCAVAKARKQQRRDRLAASRVEMAGGAPGGNPVDDAMADELQTHVRRAIQKLPLKQRLAVTLFELDDMTLAQTADAAGCSVGAVKLHLHRARRKLAKTLAEYVEEA